MATKILYTDLATAGIITLGCRVQRVVDDFYLDDADGIFKVGIPADQDLLVTEGPAFRYVTTENRVPWNNGLYRIQFFDSATAKPIASGQIEIINDAIVTEINTTFSYFKTLSDLIGKVLSKLMGV